MSATTNPSGEADAERQRIFGAAVSDPAEPPSEGQVRPITIEAHGGNVTIAMMVLAFRWMFGRREWLLAPVYGEGQLWAAEGGPLLPGVDTTPTDTEATKAEEE